MHQFDIVAENLPDHSERDENVVGIIFDEKDPDRRIQRSRFFVLLFFLILFAHSPPPTAEIRSLRISEYGSTKVVSTKPPNLRAIMIQLPCHFPRFGWGVVARRGTMRLADL